MNLKKFDDWPSPERTKKIIYLGFVILWINFTIMIFLTLLSRYPATFVDSQLSFSGQVIKSHFKEMSAEQLRIYVIYQLLDCFYDFLHITFFFSFTLFLARKFDEDSRWRDAGYKIAIIGLFGAISDLIENSLIIMMTTDPQGFPDIWAVAHSWFAVIKFSLWAIQAVWLISSDIKLFKTDVLSKKSFLAVIGIVFSVHWAITIFGLLALFGVDVAAMVYG